MVIKAFAKINLDLYVTGKRSDGYHNLYSHMHTISLYDTVRVEKKEAGDTRLVCDKDITTDITDNTAYKAAVLMKREFGFSGAYDISIKKGIPEKAGLGGSSTDAAAVMSAINLMEKANIENEILRGLGAGIGADVPFFIEGGSALCTGIGEIIEQRPKALGCHLLIAVPARGVSTPWAFKEFDLKNNRLKMPSDSMDKALDRGDIRAISDSLYNDLEGVVIPEYPVIDSLKGFMTENGAAGSLMSGSGSGVYGIFTDQAGLKSCSEKITDTFEDIAVYTADTI